MSKKDIKLARLINRGSAKSSIKYRHDAEIKVRQIMMENPYVSLHELEKLSGYSRNTIASAYIRIRKSPEWHLRKVELGLKQAETYENK